MENNRPYKMMNITHIFKIYNVRTELVKSIEGITIAFDYCRNPIEMFYISRLVKSTSGF